MQIQSDQRGNQYIDVQNVRITYVCASDREPSAEWAGSDVFRIQAYKGGGSRALHMGAELMLPANRPEAMLEVIEALCELWRTKGHARQWRHPGSHIIVSPIVE